MTTGALSPAEPRAVAGRPAGHRGARGPNWTCLIVGGGVVGAGAALDAATRGLDVGIVEARDWASGTSSRSSKFIHGGLRYLEMLDFALVREALQERGLLLERIAPHLVRPVPFLYPLTKRFVERAYVGAGVALYDALAAATGRGRGVPHKHLSRRRTLRAAPSLKQDAMVGAIRYYDAQVDDARLVVTLVRTAAALRSASREPARRSSASCARANAWSAPGCATGDRRASSRSAPSRWSTPPACGRTTPRRWSPSAGSSACGRPRASTWWCRGTVPVHGGPDPAHREVRAVRHPVGPALDHRHHGHRLDLDKAHPAASSPDIDYLLEHVNQCCSAR